MNIVNQIDQSFISTPTFQKVYSSYTVVNEILSRYNDKLQGGGITLRVKGDEIGECVLDDAQVEAVLEELLSMAEEAVNGCKWSYMRYVQLNNMVAQNKQFLKVTYPCETNQNIQNIHYQALAELLKKKNGYIHLENLDDENTLMIAVDTTRKQEMKV